MSIFWNIRQSRVIGMAASAGAIVLILSFNQTATSQDDFEDVFGTGDDLTAGETELEIPGDTDAPAPSESPDEEVVPEEAESGISIVFPAEAFRFAPPNFRAFMNPEAGEAYLEGHDLAVQGNYTEAIQLFAQAIAIDPRFVDALFERGLALVALGEKEQAIQSLAAAATYASPDPRTTVELNTMLGQQLMEVKLYREAAEAFGRARQADVINVGLRLLEGSALVRFGLELQSVNPADAQEILATGANIFDESLDEENAEAEYYFLRGTANYQLGNLEYALEDMIEADRLDPTEWKYMQRIGFIEMFQGHVEGAKELESSEEIAIEHYQAAIVAFDRYLKDNPGDPDPEEPEEEEDLEDLFLPIEIYLGRTAARLSMAKLLPEGDFQKECLIGAVADCDAAILLDEERAVAFIHRGSAERLLESFDEALASLTEAIRLDPSSAEAYLLRGIVWFYLDENDLALGDFQMVSGPGADPRFLFWSGLVHAKKGDFFEAINSYSEVLRANSNHHLARINRGLAYLQIDEGEKAITEFNHLILLDPQNAQAFYYRGLAYELSMLETEAISSYRRALAMDPLLEEAQLRLEGMDVQ